MTGDDDDMPRVEILPAVQAEIDAHPEIAKLMPGIKEALLNAMQGVKDGRYDNFEDAVVAQGLERPRPVEPPSPPRFGYFLCCGPNPNSADGIMAVITDGHPSKGHSPIEVLDMQCFKGVAEAEAWFDRTCPSLPWRRNDE